VAFALLQKKFFRTAPIRRHSTPPNWLPIKHSTHIDENNQLSQNCTFSYSTLNKKRSLLLQAEGYKSIIIKPYHAIKI